MWLGWWITRHLVTQNGGSFRDASFAPEEVVQYRLVIGPIWCSIAFCCIYTEVLMSSAEKPRGWLVVGLFAAEGRQGGGGKDRMGAIGCSECIHCTVGLGLDRHVAAGNQSYALIWWWMAMFPTDAVSIHDYNRYVWFGSSQQHEEGLGRGHRPRQPSTESGIVMPWTTLPSSRAWNLCAFWDGSSSMVSSNSNAGLKFPGGDNSRRSDSWDDCGLKGRKDSRCAIRECGY